MATISVIVPVYNAEDTLERCMGSVLAQTYPDTDVILIDDGSTDISGAMCDIYAEYDSRVRVFHTFNRGLSAARNLGIDCALSGDVRYIAFVDADDYLELDMLAKLLEVLESSGADIVQCGRVLDGFCGVSEFNTPAAGFWKREAIGALIYGDINSGVWNKLYRRRILESVRFPEGRVFEEVATMHRMVLLCDKFVSVPYCGYHHVMREGSITHTHTMSNLADYWTAYKERRIVLEKEVSDLRDEERNELVKGMAFAVSRMWRWAYANSPYDRSSYSDVLCEMQTFVRNELKRTDKSRWPVSLRAPLILAQSVSSLSLAVAYCANQLFIRLFPRKSDSRK